MEHAIIKMKMKRICKASFVVWICVALLCMATNSVKAIPSPVGIQGYVFELDGKTQVEVGTHFSVTNLANGFHIEGLTGRGSSSGKYAVTLKGNDGDHILIKAWNQYHSSNRTLPLEGVMRDVPLLLDTTGLNQPPVFNSTPITWAVANSRYVYDVDAFDPEGSQIRFHLKERPPKMRIHPISGVVSWNPRMYDVRAHEIIISATAGNLTSYQEYTLRVYKYKPSDLETQEETDKSTQNSVTDIKLDNESVSDQIGIQSLDERPPSVDSISKRVYEYIDITSSSNISGAIIEFRVEKTWLEQNNIEKENMVLNHFTEQGWIALPTKIIGEDDEYVYYRVQTPGFSIFAISVAAETDLARINNNLNTYTTSKPTEKNVYSLTGVVYYKDRQVSQNTGFVITNLNTTESFSGSTGLGPHSGALLILVQGNVGDLLTLELTEPEQLKTTFVLTGDMRPEFRFKSSPITKTSSYVTEQFKSPYSFLIIFSLAIILAILTIIITRRYAK